MCPPKPEAAPEAPEVPDAGEELPEAASEAPAAAEEPPDGSVEPVNALADEDTESPDPPAEDADAEAAACADGMALMEEFATGSDDGCRPETCENGRDDRGECLAVEADPAGEEPAAASEEGDPLPWDAYGLEGCTQVSLGVCDLDGVRYCHDTVTGWAECPGQPSGDPCDHDPADPLSVTGSFLITGQIPEVVLTAGLWTMHVCLSGNNIATGNAEPFQVALFSPIGESGGWPWPPAVLGPETVTDGFWQVPLEVPDVVVNPT